MPNVHRLRHTDPQRVIRAPVDSATVIEVGDQLFYDTDDVKPASDITFVTSLTVTKQDFADRFAGIAMTASAAGETDPVTVATEGVFEMDCAAAQFELFEFVTPSDDGSQTLDDQSVVETSTGAEAIAWVAKRYGANTTRVLVELLTKDARLSNI